MRILPELSDAMKIAAQGIVGSAIIKLLEKYGKDALEQVGAYVKSMKDAVGRYKSGPSTANIAD